MRKTRTTWDTLMLTYRPSCNQARSPELSSSKVWACSTHYIACFHHIHASFMLQENPRNISVQRAGTLVTCAATEAMGRM